MAEDKNVRVVQCFLKIIFSILSKMQEKRAQREMFQTLPASRKN